jgi:hypothetical protein
MGASGLPRAFEEPPAAEGEGRTQVYRPDETGRRARPDAASNAPEPPRALSTSDAYGETPRPRSVSLTESPEVPVPIKRKRGVPLLVVLVGFLLVGFGVVAGVMHLMKH